jgi:hypothetical protein
LSLTHHPLHTTLKDAVRALLAPPPVAQVNAHLDHIRFYLESLPSRTSKCRRSTPRPESMAFACFSRELAEAIHGASNCRRASGEECPLDAQQCERE